MPRQRRCPPQPMAALGKKRKTRLLATHFVLITKLYAQITLQAGQACVDLHADAAPSFNAAVIIMLIARADKRASSRRLRGIRGDFSAGFSLLSEGHAKVHAPECVRILISEENSKRVVPLSCARIMFNYAGTGR